MKKTILSIAALSVIMLGNAAAESLKSDVSPCYLFPSQEGVRPQALRLNVAYHSKLVGSEGEQFGYPPRISYSVHGTQNIAPRGELLGDVRAVTGTIVVATPEKEASKPATGARMGLVSVDAGSGTFLRCSTDELTPTPNTWHCESGGPIFDLTKVDPSPSSGYGGVCNVW